VWEADAAYPEKTAALRTAWAEVMDPEISLNIVQLGLVREVSIREDGASIRMILTTPYCPYGPAMMENARLKAEKTLGIPVVMEYGTEAWDPAMMEDDAGMEWGLLY
jgi:metal-sulfur cluster biosynthetic enzyme